jgi:hypothetical protein
MAIDADKFISGNQLRHHGAQEHVGSPACFFLPLIFQREEKT